MVLSKTYSNLKKIIELVPPNSREQALQYLGEIINAQASDNDHILNLISLWIHKSKLNTEAIDVNESIATIMEVVAQVLTIKPSSIYKVSRERELVVARQYAFWCIMALHPRLTLQGMGRLFNRDHATIIHAKKSFYNQVETSDEYYRDLDLIVKALKIKGIDITVPFITLSNQRNKAINERKAKLPTKNMYV